MNKNNNPETASLSPLPMAITMIGPLPPPYGGTTVYFNILQKEIKQQPGIDTTVISTTAIAKSGGIKKIQGLLRILAAPFARPGQNHLLSAHMSIGALSLFAPWLVLAGKLTGTPVIIHRFGGDLIDTQSAWRSKALWFSYRLCRAALVETRAQMMELEPVKSKTTWFPNIRKPPATPPRLKSHCRKYLYLSQIFPEKGVTELLSAFSMLRESRNEATLSIYGPILKNSYHERDFAQPGVQYGGVVQPEDIFRVIAEHDALVLPSYYKGEGYPGIIVEAFQMGVPVISTRWQSIPDIVDDHCGLLVPPRDAVPLQEAMATLYDDETRYQSLASGALQQAKQFSSDTAVATYVALCRSLVKRTAD